MAAVAAAVSRLAASRTLVRVTLPVPSSYSARLGPLSKRVRASLASTPLHAVSPPSATLALTPTTNHAGWRPPPPAWWSAGGAAGAGGAGARAGAMGGGDSATASRSTRMRWPAARVRRRLTMPLAPRAVTWWSPGSRNT
jgi:hypothetical protein